MAKYIRLNDGGAQYNHLLAAPDEDERDFIFGGHGDDIIVGDNEGLGDYWEAGGSRLAKWSEYEDYLRFYGIISVYHNYPHDEDSSDTILAIHPNGATQAWTYQDIDEFIAGWAGNDFLMGGGGNDWLVGGSENDMLGGGTGCDLLDGGTGNDIIVAGGGGGFDLVLGGQGNDIVSFQSATRGSYADGGADTDTLKLDPAYDTFAFDLVTGSDGLTTGSRFNAINFELLEYNGGSGLDDVSGGALEDKLRGNGGDDYLDGRGGNDDINGGDGNDTLIGGDGNDYISGGNNVDRIEDGKGDDTVYSGDGDDFIYTGEGNDIIHGGNGDDTIAELGADDVLNLFRNANDRIFGEDGDDVIYGGTGKDIIFGGDDNDIISGGRGADELTGNYGMDTFLFQFSDHENFNGNLLMGMDRIKDFHPVLDKLDISDFAAYATGGQLYLDDNDGTPGEAGEVMFTPRGSNSEHTMLSLDLQGDGKYDLRVLFEGLAFDPDNFSAQNVLLVSV
jgi:Ca2+-binding RTX toxin-like protein